jgi:PTS system cellobiose-specific IIC component
MKDWLNNTLIPAIMKFAALKPMMALRNGMLYVMPLTIVGSIFLLLASYDDVAFHTGWISTLGYQVSGATFDIIALVAVVGIAINYIKENGIKLADAIPGGFIAMSSLLMLQNGFVKTESEAGEVVQVGSIIEKGWTGGKGMIAAILIGLLTGFIYSWFIKRDIRIKLPDGVPEAVAGSFTALIPTFVTLSLNLGIFAFFKYVLNSTFFDWIYQVLQLPLQGTTDTLGGAIVLAVIIPIFWFFGIHGATVIGGIMGPILTANSLHNQELWEKGGDAALTVANGGKIVTQQFLDQFMTFTGSGVTIGLVVYMVFLARSAQYKTLGRLSIAPGIFNINEPIIFATPVVMNPIMFVPFVLAPLVSGMILYAAQSAGLVPLFRGVMVPWVTPPIISGFLIQGWQAAVCQVVCLVATFFVYLPFARKMDQITCQQEADAEAAIAASKAA